MIIKVNCGCIILNYNRIRQNILLENVFSEPGIVENLGDRGSEIGEWDGGAWDPDM